MNYYIKYYSIIFLLEYQTAICTAIIKLTNIFYGLNKNYKLIVIFKTLTHKIGIIQQSFITLQIKGKLKINILIYLIVYLGILASFKSMHVSNGRL